MKGIGFIQSALLAGLTHSRQGQVITKGPYLADPVVGAPEETLAEDLIHNRSTPTGSDRSAQSESTG